MTHRITLPLLLAAIGLLLPQAAPAGDSVARRPNILFIYADDHSPKTVSC